MTYSGCEAEEVGSGLDSRVVCESGVCNAAWVEVEVCVNQKTMGKTTSTAT